MRALAISLILATLGVACAPLSGTLFRTTLPQPPGLDGGEGFKVDPPPVVLGDETDLVVGIEPADGNTAVGGEPIVEADPTDANALVVSWIGGACDNDAALSLRPAESGYTLELAVHGKLVMGCVALGILRGVRIETLHPVDPGEIVATRSK